jgi:fatty acid desaturase
MLVFDDLPDELRTISNGWAIGGIARCWLGIACAVALVVMAGGAAVWIAAFLTIGLMQYHLSVLGHHSTHGNLLSPPWLNDLVARALLFAPLGLAFRGARRNHLRHHVYFQQENDYERDNYDLRRGNRHTRRGLILWLGGAYVGAAVVPTILRVLRGEAGISAARAQRPRLSDTFADWAVVAVLQLFILATITAATGRWWAYGALWLGPLFTITNGLSITRATLEHADPSDPPQRLMTFPAGFLERLLWGPFNFNWHAEHHLFPAVPACNLALLHPFTQARAAEIRHAESVRVIPSYSHRIRMLLDAAIR